MSKSAASKVDWSVWATQGVLRALRWATGMHPGGGRWQRPRFCDMRSAPRSTADVSVRDLRLPPGAAADVSVRVWAPVAASAAADEEGRQLPVVAYVHGGGWVLGHGDDVVSDRTCRRLAAGGFVVASCDYSLAPEHPFPAAPKDVDAFVRFVLEGGLGFCADPSRVALMGDSAGGNLATVAAMLARDREASPMPKLQVLVYPGFLDTPETPSKTRLQNAWILSHDFMDFFHEQYLPGGGAAAVDPALLPLLNPRHSPHGLAGMPPALVITGELCPLQDEGAEYARMLAEAGVPVVHEHIPGLVHGGMSFPGVPCERLWEAVFRSLRSI